jgi:hypothetical protein
MKLSHQALVSIEVCLEELVDAFKSLPPNDDDGKHHHAIRFPVTNDYGDECERHLLFKWNAERKDWELNTKGHDLIITASRH